MNDSWFFHVLLLEQKTKSKRQVDKTTSRLEFENDSDGKKYKIEAICDNTVCAIESDG